MNEFEHLGSVAEIAAALLGFVAIFLALSKSDGRFAESDRHFIQALVLGATTAVIVSLTPRVFSFFLTEDAVWFWATVVGLTLGSMGILLQVHLQLRMSETEAAEIHWSWHVGAWGLVACVSLLFIVGLIDRSNTAAYFVSGVSMMIPLCLWVFVGVVFRRFF